MKTSNISIKWKIFFGYLIFAIVLLGVLWLFQVVYLNEFYTVIKRREARTVLSSIETILENEDETAQESIDELAAASNMAVFVTDNTGVALYNAEYIHNSQMSSLPYDLFLDFYQKAKDEGGYAEMEYEGSHLKEEINPADAGKFMPNEGDIIFEFQPDDNRLPYTIIEEGRPIQDFRQNLGNEFAQSVICIKILELDDTEVVIMVNAVLTPVDSVVSTLKTQLIMISAIMALVAAVSAFLISRSISGSIIKVSESASHLAKGNYDTVFDSRDYREISELSDTLNFAASELKKTDKLQKELIANVSHDLRTPLTMIKGYAEVMRDLPGENTPENVQVIIDETERLSGLVNDLLDISRLQANNVALELSEYNITESIRQVLNRYNKLREVEGYIINFEYDDEIVISADEAKIYQVLYNLINNAINYCGPDKTVTVRQLINEDKLRIEVSDTGEGIKGEDLPYVWDRYYKDKSSHKRALKGTGLGLSIVKNVLDLHKATCGVNSTPGKGATFWFELDL